MCSGSASTKDSYKRSKLKNSKSQPGSKFKTNAGEYAGGMSYKQLKNYVKIWNYNMMMFN